MHFGEYELSPSLISLSPLPSAHPEAFQRLLVRTSIWCYPDFILAKGRSLGFASAAADLTPCSDSLSLRLRDSCPLTLPKTATRRFIMQKARRHIFMLRPLVGARFQVLFHSSVRSAFHLSLTVLVHYRSQESVQAWRVVPPASHRVSRVRRYSGAHRQGAGLRVRGCDPVSPALPGRSAASRLSYCHVVGPTTPAAVASAPVWPRSPFARHYSGNLV